MGQCSAPEQHWSGPDILIFISDNGGLKVYSVHWPQPSAERELGRDNSQIVHSVKIEWPLLLHLLLKWWVISFLVNAPGFLCLEQKPHWQGTQLWKPRVRHVQVHLASLRCSLTVVVWNGTHTISDGMPVFPFCKNAGGESSQQLLWFKKISSHSITHLYSACLMVLPYDFLKTFTFLPLMEPANLCKHGKMGMSKRLAIVMWYLCLPF